MRLSPGMPSAALNCLVAVARLLCCHDMDRVSQCVEVLTLLARFSQLVVEATPWQAWAEGLAPIAELEALGQRHGDAFEQTILEDISAGSCDSGHARASRDEDINRRYLLWKRYLAAWYVEHMARSRRTDYLQLLAEVALIAQAFQRLRSGAQPHLLRLRPPRGQEEDVDPEAYKLFLRQRMDLYASDLLRMGLSRLTTREEAVEVQWADLPLYLRSVGLDVTSGE